MVDVPQNNPFPPLDVVPLHYRERVVLPVASNMVEVGEVFQL